MADYLWLFTTAGGAAILAIVIAYALLLHLLLTRDEPIAQDRKVEELYKERDS